MSPESQVCTSGTIGSGEPVRTHPGVGHIDLGFSPALPLSDLIHPVEVRHFSFLHFL